MGVAYPTLILAHPPKKDKFLVAGDVAEWDKVYQ